MPTPNEDDVKLARLLDETAVSICKRYSLSPGLAAGISMDFSRALDAHRSASIAELVEASSSYQKAIEALFGRPDEPSSSTECRLWNSINETEEKSLALLKKHGA